MSKEDKYMGVPTLQERRHPHPERERATPRKKPNRTRPEDRKRFGYRYRWTLWRSDVRTSYVWFKTREARDQSYEAFMKKISTYDWYKDVEKVER